MLEKASVKAESGLISPQSFQTIVHAVGLTFMDPLMYEKLGRIQLHDPESPEEPTMEEQKRIYADAYMTGFKDGLWYTATRKT
jgi:hypothetical protein